MPFPEFKTFTFGFTFSLSLSLSLSPTLALVLGLSLSFLPLSAQPFLSIDEALTLGLKNNYSISMARNQSQLASNKVKSIQGNLLPSASANLTQSGQINSPGPRTSLGASVNWTLFDGLQTYHAIRQVKAEERSAVLEERVILENKIESILLAYYDIVQQKQKLEAIKELLAVSEERGKLATAKLEIGSGSRLEQLQSMADLNQDSSHYINQTVSLQNAKVRLNQILARDPGLDFTVIDSIPLNLNSPVEDWRRMVLENNTAIAAARARRLAAAASVHEARGHWLPSLNTGMAYSAAPGLLNQNDLTEKGGLTYSLNLTLPLFDKLATPTGITRAKLEFNQSEIQIKLSESNALAEFEQTRNQYLSGIHLIQLEERNLQVSRLQAEGARERFKAGASTPLEFRDAQTKLLDAEVRLITAIQKAKQAETTLQKLAGLLVKQTPANTEGE